MPHTLLQSSGRTSPSTSRTCCRPASTACSPPALNPHTASRRGWGHTQQRLRLLVRLRASGRQAAAAASGAGGGGAAVGLRRAALGPHKSGGRSPQRNSSARSRGQSLGHMVSLRWGMALGGTVGGCLPRRESRQLVTTALQSPADGWGTAHWAPALSGTAFPPAVPQRTPLPPECATSPAKLTAGLSSGGKVRVPNGMQSSAVAGGPLRARGGGGRVQPPPALQRARSSTDQGSPAPVPLRPS